MYMTLVDVLRSVYTSARECGGEREKLSVCALFASASSTALKYYLMLDTMNMSVTKICVGCYWRKQKRV